MPTGWRTLMITPYKSGALRSAGRQDGAGALTSVISPIGVFLIGSRRFIANLAAGALKF
ncbi:hypothetical protein AB0D91_30420 [Streptomyces canus]|uniref:hypothetical protein n=1 Tax=Streptomyces canus TaxID=58343 RepID=UPI0033EDCFCC